MGFGVWSLGFGVWGLGFVVWGLRFGVWGLEFGVWGSECGEMYRFGDVNNWDRRPEQKRHLPAAVCEQRCSAARQTAFQLQFNRMQALRCTPMLFSFTCRTPPSPPWPACALLRPRCGHGWRRCWRRPGEGWGVGGWGLGFGVQGVSRDDLSLTDSMIMIVQ